VRGKQEPAAAAPSILPRACRWAGSTRFSALVLQTLAWVDGDRIAKAPRSAGLNLCCAETCRRACGTSCGCASSPPLPAHLISECRLSASRSDLVALPRGGRIAKVGSYKGDFAKVILARCQPCELHLIDLAPPARSGAGGGCPRAAPYRPILRHARTISRRLFRLGLHRRRSFLRRHESRCLRRRSEGQIGRLSVFNDFTYVDPHLGAYGVHRAEVEFATSQNWPFTWFSYEGDALYDVALRRPPSDS
jgi:hypothetical protein